MNNTNNPVYQIVRETSSSVLLKILTPLMRQNSTKPEYFEFEEHNFYQMFLTKEKLLRLSEEEIGLFKEIIQHVENLKLPHLNLKDYIENNKSQFLTLLESNEKLVLSILEQVKLDDISYHSEIIQSLFGQQKNECVSYILKNYPHINFNGIYYYEAQTLGENNKQVAISYKPIIEALSIGSLSEFKNLFLQYGDTIDFFKATHTKIYSKKSITDLLPENKTIGQLNSTELQALYHTDTKPLFSQYTTVVNRLVQKLSKRYKDYVESSRRTRYDQRDMKTIQQDCLEFFKVLENSRTNYIDENAETKHAFNQLLITLAPYFKTINKKLLTNKKALAAVDLNVFNAKKINLTTSLIKALDFDLLERVLTKKNLTINDISYKNNFHLGSSILSTFLSDDIKKISKSQSKERQEALDKLIQTTNWQSVDKYGNNIAIQFLLQKASSDTTVAYNPNRQSLDATPKEKGRYTSSSTYYGPHMSLFSAHKVSMSQPNRHGLTAQDLLFDFSIENDSTAIFDDFLKGNTAYGVKGYNNYSEEEKIHMLNLMAARFSEILPDLEGYSLSRRTQRIFDKLTLMGIPDNAQLTDKVMKKFIEQPEFVQKIKTVGRKLNDMKPLQDLIISIDKYELNREMLKQLSPETNTKPVRKFKL